MVIGALGQFLASLAWSYLKWHLEREEIRGSERSKIALESLEKVNAALDWKANNPIAPASSDPFGDFMRPDKQPSSSASDESGGARKAKPPK